MSRLRYRIGYWVSLLAGILAFLLILVFVSLDPERPETTATLAVATLMAIWWITEVIPLAVTSLLPVVLFPALGIMNGNAVSSTYFNSVIFLFLGGFMVALAMQKWNLHRRIALRILLVTGTSQARILMGFMLATAFLSMWISNTATTMMMVPILISVISELESHSQEKQSGGYPTGLLLGVAYSASIGGMMTLVGTPPNLAFTKIYSIMFPDAAEISFGQWMIFAMPAGLAFFLFAWGFIFFRFRNRHQGKQIIEKSELTFQYRALGKPGFEEKVVLVDFIILALLWLTRSDISIGQVTIPGWSSLFAHPKYLNDGTVAMVMAIILFLVPSKNDPGKPVLDWKTARGLPWGIVLLFGGGFALAGGFKESGLSLWMGNQLQFVVRFHPILVIGVIAIFMTFLTELTSNTATTQIILPVLAGLAVASHTNPLLYMLPATLSASMAFMLPVATPPNAIIFGTNRIRISQMVRTGLIMNLAGAVIITTTVYFMARWIFGVT